MNPFGPAVPLEPLVTRPGNDPYDLEHNWDMINWESTPWRSRKRSVLRAVLLNWLIDHPDKTIKEEFGIDLYKEFELEPEIRRVLDYYGPENTIQEIWMRRYNATQRDFEIRALALFTKDRWNDFMGYGPIDKLYRKLIGYTAQSNAELEDYEYMIWYFIDKFFMTEKLPEEIFEFFPNTPRELIEEPFHLLVKPELPNTPIEWTYEYANQRSARETELNQDIRNLTSKYHVEYGSKAPDKHKINFTKRYDLKQEYRDEILKYREQEPINKPNTMTLREYGVIAAYMDNGDDLIKLAKTQKQCRGLFECFKYNPIPLIAAKDFNLFEPRSDDTRSRPGRIQRRTVRTVVERSSCRYIHYDEQEDFMLYHYSPLNNAKRFRMFEQLRELWIAFEQETEEETEETEEDGTN